MQKLLTWAFASLVAIGASGVSIAQTTLGDKAPENIPVHSKRIKPSHQQTKRQKILLKKAKVKHTAQYEFYARIEKAAKEKQKLLKKLATPQYANPLYFGHKKMPTKNPPYKMKYCKECGIRH
ncbi:MAG: hypothetical protein KF775_08345 [Cyclobacteriaceae bacterium]|nr:hypothetical protein [Cytophagales bacterium]MBX2899646.1 hypothetical protein [Cyclobacteriaceae bacterium]